MSKLLHFPRLIDCHVHFREPGLEHKGTMATEAAAAKAGGVGTVCEMPNTVPPTVTVAALAEKVRRATKIKDCDIRFFFGVTEPKHLIALRNIWIKKDFELQRLKKHCAGVKMYLDHSTGNQKAEAGVLDEAFKLCGGLKIPLVAHCEDADMNAAALQKNKRKDIAAHSVIRSPASEAKSIADAITRAKKFNTKFHVAHLSTAKGLDLVRKAKGEGVSVTCEVAPHHLFLTTNDYEALGTLGKMNPPLRSAEDRDALWVGIADGTVDCIATDHAPHTLEEKGVLVGARHALPLQNVDNFPPLQAPSGVPGVETMLPLLLTVAGGGWPHPTSKRPGSADLSYDDIVRLCFTNPNRIFSLECDPTEVLQIDPHKEWTIHGKNLHSKCGWTPFEGWKVRGAIIE